nr:4'-phosphopantetheinyl transferase superfamily protein [Bacillus cereus]
MVHQADKHRSLLAELLIRFLIQNDLNIKNEQINIKIDQYGKPYLNSALDFHFNISHSGDWIVCVIDKTCVGIDVQEILPIEFIDIVQNFFTKTDYTFITHGDVHNQLKRFYRIWALKESYIKADGRGLALPLESFTFDILNYKDIKILTSNVLKNCYFKEFNIDPTYTMAVCSMHNNFPQKITYIPQYKLVNKYKELVLKGD